MLAQSGVASYPDKAVRLVVPFAAGGALDVGSTKRYTRLPNLPTIAESVKGYEAEQWYGVVAPANTLPAIVNKLANEIRAIGAQPDARERFYSQGIEPASSMCCIT